MSNFKKLAQLNKIANECIKDGDFVLAARVHNEFMKIAQFGDAERILKSRVAKGMGASFAFTLEWPRSRDGLERTKIPATIRRTRFTSIVDKIAQYR
jgi:hypothetical protein